MLHLVGERRRGIRWYVREALRSLIAHSAGIEYLLDWDPASNPGNWMWLSCSAFFAQYCEQITACICLTLMYITPQDRVYGLVSWPSKTDKHGLLVRKYVPELAKFPDKVHALEHSQPALTNSANSQYIYEPHKAPKSVQETSGCIIGQDYPAPCLDEHHEKDRCIARLKVAYAAGLHGDHPSVLDGTAADTLKAKFRETNGQDEDDEEDSKPASGHSRKRSNGQVVSGPMDGFVRKAKVKK